MSDVSNVQDDFVRQASLKYITVLDPEKELRKLAEEQGLDPDAFLASTAEDDTPIMWDDLPKEQLRAYLKGLIAQYYPDPPLD